MRILVDVTHPAHVHFFKNAIRLFRERGHEVRVVSRVKDITVDLLDALGIEHQPLSTAPTSRSVAGFAREMLVHCFRLAGVARRFRPDVMLQIAGTFVAPVGLLLGRPSVVFYDTEHARLSNAIAYPVATAVCTPECYEGTAGRRQVRYPGYHELAYLHPDRFTPDPAVIERHGLDRDEKIFVVRFVGWAALHDYRQRGFSPQAKRAMVAELAHHGKVLITSESPLPPDLEPYRSPIPPAEIHHLLAFSTMLAGDSSTMVSEAAVLGVPAVYISTIPLGYTVEQEQRYGLVRNLDPSKQEECLAALRSVASRPLDELRAEYAAKRARLLAERIDTTAWMVEWIEKRFAS